jgi:zinc and cadmium transporter
MPLPLIWIVAGGVLMSAIALVGAIAMLLPEAQLKRSLLPLVAFSAGTLLGGSMLHLLPAAVDTLGNRLLVYLLVLAGFALLFVLEQYLNLHHCHQTECRHQAMAYLILLADGFHNLIGGMAVGAAFLIDFRVGLGAWLAAAAHEIPQELGDFAILVRGGIKPRVALFYNWLAALPFLFGGLLAYVAADLVDTALLVPFAAGNFLYIAAADLIPEVKHEPTMKASGIHFGAFLAGLGLLLAVRLVIEGTPGK